MWKRLNISTLRNTGGSKEYKRAFGKDGKQWPRLVIRVEPNPFTAGSIMITCSGKDGPGSWWEDQGIPFELLNDVIELIEELKLKQQEKA